jgi:LEA14-like dessication related protein
MFLRTDMDDRRRHKRFKVDILDVHGQILFASDVKILNISVGGALLKADRRLNIGRSYVLKMESKNHYLTVKGTVVRSTLSDSLRDSQGDIVPIYTAGIKFTDVSTNRIKEIAQFIEAHIIDYETVKENQYDMFRLSGLRLYVRFHIENPENAKVHFRDKYKVKTISLSGMLIESEEDVDTEEQLTMELTIPDHQTLSFSGKVISCQVILNTHPEVYEIAIEFVDMTDDNREILTRFLNTIGADQPDSLEAV